MNLKKETDPAEKRRAYMREYQRKRRAEKRLAKMNGQEVASVKATKKVTRKRTRTVLDDESLLPLAEWDSMGYQLGTVALNKAAEALACIVPQELGPLDIKRLVDIGVKLRTHCGASIGTEETDEEQLIMCDKVLGDDQAIDGINAVLRASARDELNEADRQATGSELPSRVCSSNEPGSMDPV